MTSPRPTRAAAGLPALALLLLLGLGLRLTIAYVLLPGSGFSSDIGTFVAWAFKLANEGPNQFYATVGFADYPPGYMYVLWVVGLIGKFLAPMAGAGGMAGAITAIIKLPAMLADLGVAAVVYWMVRDWVGKTSRGERLALIAVGIYLFNPVTWYDSAVWGQTDSVGALVVVLGLAALMRGNSEGAAGLAALSALVKPQFGIVLGAIVAIVLLKRHLFASGSGPQHLPLVPQALRSWFEDERGVWRLVSSAVVGLVVVLVMIVPFSLDLPGLIALYLKAAAGYPYLSINAYNPWAMIGAGGGTPLAFGGGWNASPDSVPLLGPIPGAVVGIALLVLGFAVGLARVAWRDDRRSILIVGIFLALAFFMLPTRVHERYMFPVFALLPVLAVRDRRWLWITIALSISSFINLHGVLTTPLYATDNLKDMAFGELFRQTPGVVASVALAVVGFVGVILQLGPSKVEEVEESVDRVAGVEYGAKVSGDVVAVGTEPVIAAKGELRMLFEDVRNTIRPLFSVLPVRRDRSAELAGEPGGKLDRKDLLLVVLVFVIALGMRTFRLEQPYGMHFDEVYHARTGTEFLQFFRYGINHSIYEYTHPHMAKYLIAAGITEFGNNQVVARTNLGTSVAAAAVETRWAPGGEDATTRAGDRLYVATGTAVRVYDLMSWAEVTSFGIPASTLAVDQDSHALYMGGTDGSVWSVNTTELDELRAVPNGPAASVQPLGKLTDLTGELKSLTFTKGQLVGLTDAGMVVTIDPATGAKLADSLIPGAVSIVGIDAGQRLVLDMSQVTDLEPTITNIATLTSGDVNKIRALVAGRTGRVVIQGFVDDESGLSDQLTSAGVTGATVEGGEALAVSTPSGVQFVDGETLDDLLTLETANPLLGMAYVNQGVDKPTIYAATTGNYVQRITVPQGGKPSLNTERLLMPGAVRDVIFNPSTMLVHVLGASQDGESATIYVVEPHGNAVFADARLDFEPATIVMDSQPNRPADDRNDILAFSAAGAVDTVDVGSNAFAWRFMGVIAGAFMAACIYLLGRFLFRRRSVAVFAAALILLDGMAFANARIAMNDTYVAAFIVGAVTLFAPIWLGRWRSPNAVIPALMGVAALLGLALASKWVAAYAIGGILLLVLLRSALGRLMALFGMVAMTAVLGVIGTMADGNGSTASANYTFLIMMIGLTVFLVVAMALRPMKMSRDEYRLAVLGPMVLGALLLVGGIVRTLGAPAHEGSLLTPGLLYAAGGGAIVLGVAAFVGFMIAGRLGFGPRAEPRIMEEEAEPPIAPPAPAWLRPGGGPLGIAWLVSLAALVIIPIAIYAASYAPWVAMGGRWTEDNPPDHPGQTLIQLQFSMYDYHNNLRATHPASSPWWAWPFDLKPVWFEQGSYAAGTASSIYDSGNLVIFWLAIPAFAFVCYQAWRRRSLSLAFVALMALSLWLPWVRIDRATFQYHFFTTLPFSVLGLAYFLSEMWHGPSPRTWLLARASAAAAILAPGLMWLLSQPLCGLAGTQRVNANSDACGGATRPLVITDLQAVALLLSLLALLGVAYLAWWYPQREGWLERNRQFLVSAGVVAVLAGIVLAVVAGPIPANPIFQMSGNAAILGILFTAIAAPFAYVAVRARDARRYAVSVVVVAALWFVMIYPNFSGLPIPSAVLALINNPLPTYNWAFQFAVNTAPASNSKIDWVMVGLLAGVLAILCAAAFYATRAWRAQRAEERALRVAAEAG